MDDNVDCLLGLVYNLMTNYSLTWLLVSVAGCLGYDLKKCFSCLDFDALKSLKSKF